MERAGRPSHAGDDRRAAQARNEERASIDAELAAVSAAIIDLQAERDRRAGSAIDERIQDTMKEICRAVPRDIDRHLSR
jgi:hypothetical protein